MASSGAERIRQYREDPAFRDRERELNRERMRAKRKGAVFYERWKAEQKAQRLARQEAVNREESVEEDGPVPADMASRAGLRALVATSDETLGQRPVELLARLARATRLCAISNALVWPEHPGLQAKWDQDSKRWVSATTGKPVDCIRIADRAIHLHRAGESEPTSVIAMRKPDDLVSLVLLAEEMAKFETLASVRVAQRDLDQLTDQIASLGEQVGAVVTRLTVVGSTEAPRPSIGSSALQVEGDDAAPFPPSVRSEDSEPVTVIDRPLPLRAEVSPPPAPRSLRERFLAALDLEKRDLGSLVWLTLAGVVSYGTTWHGATAIGLREELAIVGTTFVCGFLWTLLAGLAMSHDHARKLVAELVFAVVCVYCGFFTYYEGLTKDERATSATEIATRAHEALVAQVYTSHRSEADAAKKEANSYAALKADEVASGGAGTGVRGYGPRAKQLALLEGEATLRGAKLEGQLSALEGVVHTSTDGLTPDEVHLLDVRIWSAAPAEWRPASPPERSAYVDLDVPRSPVLLPLHAVQRGEPEAYVALVCAAAIEGMMLWCGAAIERRKRERLIPRVMRASTRVAREVKDARASAKAVRALEARARFLHPEED